MRRRPPPPFLALAGLLLGLLALRGAGLGAAAVLQPPEQFIGFKVGADNKLAHWDKVVEYMKLAGATSDRVRYRELGRTTRGNPLVVLEISSPDTLKNLDRYKQLERRLYFQNGAPSPRERDEIFRQGKVVVLVTCSVHATEVGATQMALELVHQLATDDSPAMKKVLDNVIVLLVPSLNPDGMVMVTDWFEKNLGTPYESSPMPYLYHPYSGHDNNRDMYAFTQKESQYMAQLVWHDWFPTVWADEHQMGSSGARIFVMPATDPINPNVHPLIYRWNAILGQSQAAALEAAGKEGIIHSSTYTNYWQGAMAWSGWWHNQVGLLTEVASARIASPIDQQRAAQQRGGPAQRPRRDDTDPAALPGGSLPPPTDTTPRTDYPRPWMGGRWTLRDIVDYELIATTALLDAAADRREALLRQIYEVNRQTIEEGRSGSLKAILISADQQDKREAAHLADRLAMAGVEVYRSDVSFTADGVPYEPGTFVIPMTQVFARYAKDILEKQKYPDVRRGQSDLEEPPYDVTAWSLGMLFGVNAEFSTAPLPSSLRMTRVQGTVRTPGGRVSGNGPHFTFDYNGPDTAIAVNRLLKEGARVSIDSSRFLIEGVARDRLEPLAKDLGLVVLSVDPFPTSGTEPRVPVRAPRVAVYAPWTGGNTDEGWTRWVLDQYEFSYVTVHNADIREGALRRRFDVMILPDQSPREMISGFVGTSIRPEYRGGIGEVGVQNLARFVSEGGTLVALGTASDLVIDRLPLPIRDLKRGLRNEEHFAPGVILRLQVDTSHPLGYGMAADTFAFYNNGPFFSVLEGFGSLKPKVIARYPNQDIVASGWLRGEEAMTGRAAVVSVDLNPGRVVLFGLRPQHRGQTHATFPLLFNSLFLAASVAGTPPTN